MTTFSCFYLDLDNFKAINDQHGHAVGDALFSHVSARLQNLLREGGVLARFGEDEFVLLLEHVSAIHMHAVPGRFRALLEHPYVVEGQLLTVEASLGGASYPEDGATLDVLLWYADRRMYTHKARAG